MKNTKKRTILFIALLFALCLALFAACNASGGSTGGTYYLYENGKYDKNNWIKLENGKWTDDDGESGDFTLSGTKIVLYTELFGEKEELTDGTLSDGVLTVNLGGYDATYCKEGVTPSDGDQSGGKSDVKVTVTYNANGGAFDGGAETKQTEVSANAALTAPDSPSRTGYSFNGWSTDRNGNNMWKFASDKVTKDTTLYAVWTEATAVLLSVDGASIDGTEVFMLVDKDTDSVSLSAKVVCSSDSSWKLYYDKLGQTEIPTKIAASAYGELAAGDNVFYIVVSSQNGSQVNVYTLTVHRSHRVAVSFYDGGTLVNTDYAYTGEEYAATYKPTIAGYTFNHWKKGNARYEKETLWSALSLQADKTAKTYTATLDVNGGDALTDNSKSVTYDSGYSFAVPKRTGYTFGGWYLNDVAVTDGNGKSLAVWTYAENKVVKARWQINQYTVSLTAGNSAAGSVSGGGTYNYNSKVTISATTNSGYTFVGWYKGNEKISDALSCSFTLGAQNVSYTAKWISCPVTVVSANTSAGTVSGMPTTTVLGQSVTIRATTKSGYTFTGWFDGEKEISKDLNYTFTLTEESKTYTAKWIKVTLARSNTSAGTVTSLTGTYKSGDSVTATATTNAGYTWLGWYSGETKLTEELSYTFTMPAENATYTARWIKVTLARSNTSAGTVTSLTGTYKPGDGVTATATTNVGYTWLGWFNGETKLTDELSYAFTMPAEDVTYTAKWIEVTLARSNTSAGTVSGLIGAYRPGDSVTATATTNVGYTWLGWYSGEAKLTEELSYTFTMPAESVTYTAKWNVKEEMSNFNFTSTETTCNITGIKDKTVTGIVVPEYVTSISEGAFKDCSRLIGITLPFVGAKAGVRSNDAYRYPFGYIFGTRSYTGGTQTVQYYTSAGYTSTQGYYIPATLRFVTVTGGPILAYDFWWCKSLTSVRIGTGVTSIGADAFGCCSSLTSITIPDSVTSIGSYAFSNCTSLARVYYKGTADEWRKISIDKSNTPLTDATRYYYSETKPTSTGNYWHYVDGVTTVWKED